VTRQLLLVAGVPLAVGAAAAGVASVIRGPEQWGFAGIGFGLCVPPALAVVLLNNYLIRTSPFGRVTTLFAGTFVRLAIGFGGGVVVFLLLALEERSDKIAYWAWLLFAYLTVLVVETAVLARPLAASPLQTRP